MYNNVSAEFKRGMNAKLRNRMYLQVSLGVVNQEAQNNGAFADSELAEWSNKAFPWNGKNVDTDYATLEQDFFKCDGSQVFLPEGQYKQFNVNVGVASDDLLGTLNITFPIEYDLKGLTIDFGRAYPTQFQVITDAVEKTYDNDSTRFETMDNLGTTTTLSIIPLEMVGGQQRLRIEKILMGVGLNYTNAEIKTMDFEEHINAISGELPNINFNLTIADPDHVYDVDNDDSFINYLQTGQRIEVAVGLELDNGMVEYVPLSELSLSKWQSKKETMSFSAVDKFVLLDEKYEDGFYIHSRSLYEDVIDILTFCRFEPDEYVIDDCLRDVVITNPLPKRKCKELLQLIANAGRCIVYQNRDGQIVFKANFATVIDPDDITVSSNTHAAYSKPANVMHGTQYVYQDMTRNFFSVDGSMYFLPESGSNYLETAYVSAAIADENGAFSTVPSLTLTLPAGFVYYGLTVKFDGNPPARMQIKTYYLGDEVQTVTIRDCEEETYIPETFNTFDEMVISFPVGTPNDRVLVNKVTFGELTDYTLTYQNIVGEVTGFRETKVKNVDVKIYTYENDEDDTPKEVEDDVYYTQAVNPVGETKTANNPLIGTRALARDVAEWLGFYYSNNVSYSLNYRGDPRLNSSDLIYLESPVLNNLQTEIETHKLKFNGALSGSLDLRRAIRTS